MVEAGGPPAPPVEPSGEGRSDAALGNGEAWLGQVVEAMPSALVVVSSDHVILTLNRAAERMFGYSRAELAGRPAASLLPDGSWSAQLAPGGKLRGSRKDGSEFPIDVTARPIAIGSASFVLCTILDLSSDRRPDGTAGQSEALFSAVFRASPNMISVTTMADGRYVDVNESFLR